MQPQPQQPQTRGCVLTFAGLGGMGRLGNQLFQIAAAAAFAAELGVPCVVPPWRYAAYLRGGPLADAFARFAAAGDAPPDVAVEVRERGFAHRESAGPVALELREAVRAVRRHCAAEGGAAVGGGGGGAVAVSLSGYFQSELYFAPRYAAAVRALFSPGPDARGYLDARFGAALRARPRACALHVRRGDYVANCARHALQPLSYYAAAVSLLYPDAARAAAEVGFFVFSDDPAWCREHLPPALPPGAAVLFVEGSPDDILDMWLMARCDDHVIANSSFSWWGAWLCERPGKRVVAPLSRWFGPELAHLNTADVLPAGWVGL